MRDYTMIGHLVVLVAFASFAIQAQTQPFPALDTVVPSTDLHDISILDGVAFLTEQVEEISFSFEYVLRRDPHDQPIQLKHFDLKMSNQTVREVLDLLCKSDGGYEWSLDGTMVNIFPKLDRTSLVDRRFPIVQFNSVTEADDAVFVAFKQLPVPFEQIAIAQSGGNISFRAPFSASLENVTVRHVLNLIAHEVNPRTGWILAGAERFRTITFFTGRLRIVGSSTNN